MRVTVLRTLKPALEALCKGTAARDCKLSQGRPAPSWLTESVPGVHGRNLAAVPAPCPENGNGAADETTSPPGAGLPGAGLPGAGPPGAGLPGAGWTVSAGRALTAPAQSFTTLRCPSCATVSPATGTLSRSRE